MCVVYVCVCVSLSLSSLEVPPGERDPQAPSGCQDHLLESEEPRPRAQGAGGRPGSLHPTTAPRWPGQRQEPLEEPRPPDGEGPPQQVRKGKVEGAWPDVGRDQAPVVPPLGTTGPPMGSAASKSQLSALGSGQVLLQGLNAPLQSAALQVLHGPATELPHGSHRVKPQDSRPES